MYGTQRSLTTTASLFAFLPDIPASMPNYLSVSLQRGLISPRDVFIHLLFQLQTGPIPLASLSMICGILLAHADNLQDGPPIPSSLKSPIPQPDIGTSVQPPAHTIWTLSLLLPLLRICTDPSSAPQPITELLGRMLAIVKPYPAPPFDVGLEVSQLMGKLPETIASPLKESLSGLMMDLAISDGATQNQVFPVEARVPPVAAKSQTSDIDDINSQSPQGDFAYMRPQAMALLVTNYHQSRARESRHMKDLALETPMPHQGLIKLLKICWRIFENSEALLTTLLTTMVGSAMGQSEEMRWRWDGSYVDRLIVLFEDLPVALRWWKDQSECSLPYPVKFICPLRVYGALS